MSGRARGTLLVLILILLAAGVYRSQYQLPRSLLVDSYGTNGQAFGAAYELLEGLDLPVERGFAPSSALARTATIWWLNASETCHEWRSSDLWSHAQPLASDSVDELDEAEDEEVDEEDFTFAADADPIGQWRGRTWLESGGTAVLFLDRRMEHCERWAGLMLPTHMHADFQLDEGQHESLEEGDAPLAEGHWHAGDEPSDDGEDEEEEPVDARTAFNEILDGTETPPQESAEPLIVRGDLVSEARDLSIGGLRAFELAPGRSAWRVRAYVDDRPFIIEQAVGDGLLVLVADDLFVTNRHLGYADSALLLVDLAQAYGGPMIDEFVHGHREAGGAIPYLVRSSAWPVFAGLALLGALILWRGNAFPTRSVSEIGARVPALEPFVDSLSNLYARAADRNGVLERYREVTVERARRALRFPPGTSDEILFDRAARVGLDRSELMRRLSSSPPIKNRQALEREMKALDRLLEQMIQ